LIIAYEKFVARNLFSYYDQFQKHFKPFRGIGLPRLMNRSAGETSGALRWANRCSITIATAENFNFSRSFRFRIVHLSEYGYYPSIAGLTTALVAAVPSDRETMVFKESTANSYNEFYRECIEAMEGRSDYEFLFFGCFEDENNTRSLEADNIDPIKFDESLTDEEWKLHETYPNLTGDGGLSREQLYWRRKMLEEMRNDEKKFKQEFCANWQESFQASSRQRFDPKLYVFLTDAFEASCETGDLHAEEVNRQEIISLRPNRFGSLTVWKRPTRYGEYVGGCDPARGVDVNESGASPNPDFTAAQVFDRNLAEQVAELHERLEPIPTAQYLYKLGKWYNCVYWVIEVEVAGGNGLAVLRELERLGYPMDRIYYKENLNQIAGKRSRDMGFRIDPHTRMLTIANYERWLLDQAFTLHSKMLVSESNTFVKKPTGKVEHEVNCHDDLLFAAMHATWGMEHAPPLIRANGNGHHVVKYGARAKR